MAAKPITASVSQIRGSAQQRVAIVFVHGYSGALDKTWGNFANLIKEDRRLQEWDIFSIGYTTSLFPDLLYMWSRQPSIATLSDLLRTHLTQGLLAPYSRMVLLAHSMGGLVAQRALIDQDAVRDRIDCFLLYGTPSNGLGKASTFKFWNRQVRDLGEDSEFIRDLKQGRASIFSDPPFGFATVAGDVDDFVPRTSSLDPFDKRFHKVVPGNHLEMVKPTDSSHLALLVAINSIIGDAAPLGPWSAARAAVERDEFQVAVKQLEPHAEELDPHAAVQLALALEELGRRGDALKLIDRYKDKHTDAMGVLAGRLKRRWLHERRHQDAIDARTLYEEGYELAAAASDHPQAFYLGINVAFMELAMDPDAPAARQRSAEWGRKALYHAEASPPDMWRAATEGEANLILGEPEVALQHYRDAIAMQPTPRQLSSMFQQAYHIADILYPPKPDGTDPMAEKLDGLFRPKDPLDTQSTEA
jgi:pimeloyl-ACP methyl ester carboxylesterase